jgi:hypothetical protein
MKRIRLKGIQLILLMIEQYGIPGGYATSFDREDFTFGAFRGSEGEAI